MNNGALRAVKKLYICLCAARDNLYEEMFTRIFYPHNLVLKVYAVHRTARL
jgi:hypothetical protein